ncbi:MAG: hypothetical protein HY904_17845 [Deltaproteobacteria bacterium]|nr:hypothetical protein [Deltaproteobacteria bacterium]
MEITRRALHVDMDEILAGFSRDRDDPMVPHLDLETGGVRFRWSPGETWAGDTDDHPEDEDSRLIRTRPRQFTEIPRIEPHEDARLMERFIARLDEPDVQELLTGALKRRHGLGAFRATLRGYPDLAARWERTLHDSRLKEARHWLEMIGVDATWQLRREPPQVAPKTHARETPHAHLVHLLVLGRASGTGGVAVRRQVVRPGQARGHFRRYCRQLCELKGVGWRNRFVEDRDAFTLEDVTLRHGEDWVEVEVAVPADVALQFGPPGRTI